MCVVSLKKNLVFTFGVQHFIRFISLNGINKLHFFVKVVATCPTETFGENVKGIEKDVNRRQTMIYLSFHVDEKFIRSRKEIKASSVYTRMEQLLMNCFHLFEQAHQMGSQIRFSLRVINVFCVFDKTNDCICKISERATTDDFEIDTIRERSPETDIPSVILTKEKIKL